MTTMAQGGIVDGGDQRRRQAATLLLATSALWLHEWLPALLVATWVSWLILHKRLEGGLGEALVRLWRRAWPPHALALIPLLAASTLGYWVYAPFPGKVLPIALNLVALSMVLLGAWWGAVVHARRRRRAPGAPRQVAGRLSTNT